MLRAPLNQAYMFRRSYRSTFSPLNSSGSSSANDDGNDGGGAPISSTTPESFGGSKSKPSVENDSAGMSPEEELRNLFMVKQGRMNEISQAKEARKDQWQAKQQARLQAIQQAQQAKEARWQEEQQAKQQVKEQARQQAQQWIQQQIKERAQKQAQRLEDSREENPSSQQSAATLNRDDGSNGGGGGGSKPISSTMPKFFGGWKSKPSVQNVSAGLSSEEAKLRSSLVAVQEEKDRIQRAQQQAQQEVQRRAEREAELKAELEAQRRAKRQAKRQSWEDAASFPVRIPIHLRRNDWTCPGCGKHCWGRYHSCIQCKTVRPELVELVSRVEAARAGGGPRARAKRQTEIQAWEDAASFPVPIPIHFRRNDWICPGCGRSCWGRDHVCIQCKTVRPELVELVSRVEAGRAGLGTSEGYPVESKESKMDQPLAESDDTEARDSPRTEG